MLWFSNAEKIIQENLVSSYTRELQNKTNAKDQLPQPKNVESLKQRSFKMEATAGKAVERYCY